MLNFYLCDFAYWIYGQTLNDTTSLPVILKRRVHSLMQQASELVYQISKTPHTRIILSSRYADSCRMLSILQSLSENNSISPTDFSLSSHHSLIGLLSIAQKNTAAHTAIAAGSESFCIAFLEAIAYLTENPHQNVLLIHFDEVLPYPFDIFNKNAEESIAVAILLNAQKGKKISLAFEPSISNKYSTSHARDFIKFLENDVHDMVSVGENQLWRWTHNA